MKALYIEKPIKYDGTQLHSLYAYLNHNILGNSILAWQGPCEVNFDHMVDGEDLKAEARIEGANMLHFIIEVFDQTLLAAVSLQRLFASIAKDELEKSGIFLECEGDDLYFEKRKLSISIASQSVRSVMIHFALNITNEGTPVPTAALSEWGIDSTTFAHRLLEKFCSEFQSIQEATWKVKSLSLIFN